MQINTVVSDVVLNPEKFGLDDFLKNELQFWQSMRAACSSKETNYRVLNSLKKRYNEDFVMKMAQKRFTNMVKIIKLFKDEYIQEIIDKVNRKFDIKLDKDFDFEDIKNSIPETPPISGWLMIPPWVVVVIAIVVVAIASYYDHKGEAEDPATVGTVSVSFLVDEDKSLTCDEIEGLSYSAWVTYLNMCLNMDEYGKYWEGVVCGSCYNLRLLVAFYDNDPSLLLREDTPWWGWFFLVGKLEECGISY